MFEDTIERLLKQQKRQILKGLKRGNGRHGLALELKEEPGEILITRLMKSSEIRKGVKTAIERVFQQGDIWVEDVLSSDNFVFVILQQK